MKKDCQCCFVKKAVKKRNFSENAVSSLKKAEVILDSSSLDFLCDPCFDYMRECLIEIDYGQFDINNIQKPTDDRLNQAS